MNIGVFLGDFTPIRGGGFTYQDSLVTELVSRTTVTDRFYVFIKTDRPLPELTGPFTYVRIPRASLIKKVIVKGTRLLETACGREPWSPGALDDACKRYHIDLLWFPNQATEEDVSVPFIYTILDTQHLVMPFLPETTQKKVFLERERIRLFLKRATYVITGLEQGKKEISFFHQVPQEKFRLLRHPTPSFALVTADHTGDEKAHLEALGVKGPFIFYPAQFWAHKNHRCILDALVLLKKQRIALSTVFVGSDKGNLAYVKQLTKELGLEDRVHFLGFVSRETLTVLYHQAVALVYPSLFGPENLPPLEACAFRCPVLLSDYPGAHEQMGKAADYFDAFHPEQLAEGILAIMDRAQHRSALIQNGLERAKEYTTSNYIDDVLKIISEYQAYRRLWA